SKEAGTPVAPPTTQIRQEANANVATVKPLRPGPEMAQRPRRHNEITAPAQSIPTTAQTKLPKETNANNAGVKPANPQLQTARQPQKQNEVSANGQSS